MAVVRHIGADEVGVEFRTAVAPRHALPFKCKPGCGLMLRRDDYWKLFEVQAIDPDNASTGGGKHKRPSNAQDLFRLAFGNVEPDAEGESSTAGMPNVRNKSVFADVDGTFAPFNAATDFCLLLRDGELAPLRQHQVQSLRAFQAQTHQVSTSDIQ